MTGAGDACKVELHLQVAPGVAPTHPPASFFVDCARHALQGRRHAAELTIRLVGRDESRELNRRWRGVDRATNVLSFPMTGVEEIAPDLLGDIAICAPLVHEQADARGRPHRAHWAHLVVHGILHLLGFDHERAADAQTMEDAERAILAAMGYPDPYVT